jgi:hypothetical protein
LIFLSKPPRRRSEKKSAEWQILVYKVLDSVTLVMYILTISGTAFGGWPGAERPANPGFFVTHRAA